MVVLTEFNDSSRLLAVKYTKEVTISQKKPIVVYCATNMTLIIILNQIYTSTEMCFSNIATGQKTFRTSSVILTQYAASAQHGTALRNTHL